MIKKITLELEGLDGNAFAILTAFRTQARREGWTREEINDFTQVALAGDYDHLLQTIMKYTI